MGPKSTEPAGKHAFFDLASYHRERHRAWLPSVVRRRELRSARAAAQVDDEGEAGHGTGGPGGGRVSGGSTTVRSRSTCNELVTYNAREMLLINWQAPATAPLHRKQTARARSGGRT